MSEYSEPTKVISRRKAIEFAVRTVTVERENGTLARGSYVREVFEFLKAKGTLQDKEIISYLEKTEIEKWEAFYRSVVGTKSPQDLKVAYLSGPNPINDLREFTRHGILPENVHAFESEGSTYDRAILNALDSEFPFVKIFKGKIENYFKVLKNRYDIIYLDFCGTIASSGTLSVLRELFLNQKLASPGVIITNFALPQRQKKEDANWDNLIRLAANYLYPKLFTEEFENYGGGIRESANAYGLYPHDIVRMAFQNPNTFYSQLITRILFDIPSLIIPYQKFASNNSLVESFFRDFNVSSLPSDWDEDIITFPESHSLIWGMKNYIIPNSNFGKFLSKVRRQIAIDSDESKFLDTLMLMDFFMKSNLNARHNSTRINEMQSRWNFEEKYIFCDVFLFHQLKELLVGQLTAPYFYNVGKTKRWTYRARTNRMFLDVVTYDECRYIFDWMPTLDMFEHAVSNIDRQFTLRFALDCIAKNRRWYNAELFMGTAVVSQTEKGFEAKGLEKRIKIN